MALVVFEPRKFWKQKSTLSRRHLEGIAAFAHRAGKRQTATRGVIASGQKEKRRKRLKGAKHA